MVPTTSVETALEQIEGAVSTIITALGQGFGLDYTHDNFRETPKRVAKAYKEIFSGLRDTDKQIEEILSKAFPSTYTGMVLMKNVEVFSVCPHHLLPCELKVSAAYIPGKRGKVLGISKLVRIIELLAKRPILQEDFTSDITDAFMQIKGAAGAACLVEGRHFCMVMRGVCKPDAVTVTSSMQGLFLEDVGTKNEFMDLVRTKG